jgi:signal-transduction protein with cAMP-binding, CBS, and nucleotidyltransferase domain
VLVDIANSMEIEEHQKEEMIFDYGVAGDKLYLMINGSVRVMLPNPDIANWTE